MSNPNVIFQGNVRVYLQGKNALYPIDAYGKIEGMFYHIGQANIDFIVQDYRKKSVAAAQKAIEIQYQNGFSSIFNQQACARIHYELHTEKIEIELRDLEGEVNSSLPLLWMGVLEDNLMQGYEVEWEVFKTIDENNTAFIAFISSTT